MMGYNDTYVDTIRLIDSRIKNNTLQSFFAKVSKSEGNYVDCELTTGENTLTPLTKIPVFQSAYLSPIVKEGDFGLLLNCGISLDGALQDKDEALKMQGQNYFIFIPLIKDADFKSATNTLTINSEDLKSKIELTNEKLSANLEKDYELIAKGSYSVTNEKAMKFETKDAYTLTCKSFSVEASGADPIVVKNSVGGLKEVIDSLFQCLDGLSAGLTGVSSNPAAYQAAKPAAQQMINKIIG